MNIKICQKLTLWYYNLKNNLSSSRSTLSLPFTSGPIKNILVCLPESPEDFRVAQTQLPTVADAFPSSTISLLLNPDYLKFTNGIQNCRLITYSPTEFDLLGLPKKSLWQKLAPQTFEITVDFNTEFRLPIAALCRKINSPFRLTLAKPNDVLFFNIILRISNRKNYSEKLESLLHYLYTVVTIPKPSTSKTTTPFHKA